MWKIFLYVYFAKNKCMVLLERMSTWWIGGSFEMKKMRSFRDDKNINSDACFLSKLEGER